MDMREIFREGWQSASEQMIKFRSRSQTDSPDGWSDIATLVRHALAEVCTVPMLLVLYYILHVCCITLCQRVQWRCVRVCTAEMCRAVDWQSNCFPREQQESLRNTFQLLQQISGECCHCATAEYLKKNMANFIFTAILATLSD